MQQNLGTLNLEGQRKQHLQIKKTDDNLHIKMKDDISMFDIRSSNSMKCIMCIKLHTQNIVVCLVATVTYHILGYASSIIVKSFNH